ncbi:EpsI family protein [Desulfosarcina ovata subsp. sediminis]|uniref:EpsI family protein n=1 Tax=Desulfosarcina ovata subsp. sediminis TaxID=885957 RepID=A0A5K7ZGF5_9BACT|nr:exosortase C-terminal domain/associated protein EpsI [Desulfosarcina ovata]BBO81278.1 EpsI family protein [Desulfosarcina ovata subsp. sediminis]
MGIKSEIKLIVLAVLFSCACVAVYGWDKTAETNKKPPLTETFHNIERYTLLRNIKLADNAFEMLNLDDYVFADYAGPSGQVNLYIGYYFSSDKAYASHSPTICYPSQGWKLDSEPSSGKHIVRGQPINYNEIVTSFGHQRELVLYWYQARLHTNTQVYKNKIDIGLNKIAFHDNDHGFVRVALSFSDRSYDDTKGMRSLSSTHFIRNL